MTEEPWSHFVAMCFRFLASLSTS